MSILRITCSLIFLIPIPDNWLKVLISSEEWRRLQLLMNDLFLNAKLPNVECLNLKAQRYTHTLHVMCDLFFVCLFVFEFANIFFLSLKC